MKTLLLTFGIFIIVILGMAVGYIFSKRTIKGSCGGISSLGMKKMCDCDTPCDTLQKELDKNNIPTIKASRLIIKSLLNVY
ncbi:periplasmic protein [Neisseria flavescens]|uniref:(Na+)-NQR maturation NqrM n=1 Tax=Neisseria flavescens TaxID=484 RepID=UPI0007A8EE8F|nr:(Na+)-NQR maturation NqrM [Neisseria flavescens]KZC87068.1 periplasmic protein [Neisseria flavescens]